MNKLTILGSSSGVPAADRASSGYVLQAGSGLTLIDCGGGVTSSFLRRGLDHHQVGRIIISHTHPDHVCELPLFIQLTYVLGRTAPLEVLVPEEFVVPFENYLRAVYLIREKIPFALEVRGYSDGFTLETADYTVQAIGNSHLEHYREYVESLGLPNRMQSHSLLFTVGTVRYLHSADLGSYDDIRGHLRGVDLAVIESTHVDVEQILDELPDLGVGRLVFTHLGRRDDVVRINELAANRGLGNVMTAVDGLELPL